MRGRIRSEGQAVLFGISPEMIENYARFNASRASGRIDFQDTSHVPREIQHDGDVAALSGERCTASARQQRRMVLSAERNRSKDILDIARENDSNRNLAVIGAVRGIESAAGTVEPNVPAKMPSQCCFERLRIDRFRARGECAG